LVSVRTALFIHHSIGRQMIHGGLRDLLAVGRVDLWDHDYNEIGLTRPDGLHTGRAFPVPGDDTDPAGLLRLLRGMADGAGWRVPAHDLLVLKSCFPNSAVESVPAMQEAYDELREVARKLPQSVLLLTSPPLVVESTSIAQARRAEDVADWLVETWTGNGLHCANLFAALSYRRGPLRGTLRTAYRSRRPRDSHLSPAGERAAARFASTAILAACPVVTG
jgi:hypothetical protein